jgi:2-polyprenyl-3-methyl-5-hydroxy-6-metoxy-1,4-benzoquinol methylase
MKTPHSKSLRAKREIKHSQYLAQADTEKIWGWGTTAGRIRARRRADVIARGARLGPGVLALEVGCGTGLFTDLFVRTGAKIVAVDISPDLLEKARKRKLPEQQVQFVEIRFEDSAIHGPFDAVIGSSILHHLEVERSLAKVYELLRPGGRMVFAEPNILNPQVYSERKFSHLSRFAYVSPDETAFVRWSLSKLLLHIGFEGVLITPFDWLHSSTPLRFVEAIGRLGFLLERLPIVREFSGSLLIEGRRPL